MEMVVVSRAPNMQFEVESVMGTIMCGAGKKLDRSDSCLLVSSWCNKYDDRQFDEAELSDRSGTFDYPADIVVRADADVPLSFDEAKAKGFVQPIPNSVTFDKARTFLRHVAENNRDIGGSY